MGDGHFSPAGIDCSYACLVLFSTYTAHIRAVGNPHVIQRTLDTLLVYRHTHQLLTERGCTVQALDRGV